MSGKKKMKGLKSDNRGGVRKSAGRKKIIKNLSIDVKEAFIQAAEKLEKQHGYGVEECILRLIYEDNTQDSVRVAIAKLYVDVLVTRESKKTTTRKSTRGPEIYLPKEMEDPAKTIPGNSGSGIYLPKRKPDSAKEILSKSEPNKNKVIKLDEKK